MTAARPSPRGKRLGRLVLVPAPLDFACGQAVALSEVLPDHTLAQAARLHYWIAENAKSARAYLKRVAELHPLAASLQDLHIQELPRAIHKTGDHAGQKNRAKLRKDVGHGAAASLPATTGGEGADFDPRSLLLPALQGQDIGLVSEAGMPGVADPGSSIVRTAHQLGLRVVPLSGPVSLLLALAASGLNGQSFAFVGYLPQNELQRVSELQRLEALARRSGQAQILIETPYRNEKLWQAMLKTLRADTWLSLSAGLSLPQAISESHDVATWRRLGGPCPADGKTPAVFVMGC